MNVRTRGFTIIEALVILIIVGILCVILMPVFFAPVSFTSTSMPPMSFQNVELQSAMNQIYRTLQKEKGNNYKYAQHFNWETERLKKRRVWLETSERLTLKEMFRRIEKAAQVKVDYLRHPEDRGMIGKFIIRDARKKSQQPPNKALHPISYSPLVPRSLSAAGELGRSPVAQNLAAVATIMIMDFDDETNGTYIIPNCLKQKTTAIIYTRVSTKQQVKGSGLWRQREGCTAFAQQAGLVVVEVHEDAGVSGDFYLGRSALQAALRDLETGRAEVLIVEDFDRLSRNQEHTNAIVNRVQSAGAVLIISEAQRINSPTYNFIHQTNQMLQEHKQAVLEGRA